MLVEAARLIVARALVAGHHWQAKRHWQLLAMRPIAVGRKNYLFAGSHDAAANAAVIYSLLGTARLHKVNPALWLKYIFTNMRAHHINKLPELLPFSCNFPAEKLR